MAAITALPMLLSEANVESKCTASIQFRAMDSRDGLDLVSLQTVIKPGAGMSSVSSFRRSMSFHFVGSVCLVACSCSCFLGRKHPG